MDNVQESATTTPQGQVDAETKTPDTSSDETSQNDAVGVEQPKTPEKGESKEVEEKKFEMPEKFQGKSAEEIAQSYTKLESQNTKVEMERSELEKLFVDKTDETTESTSTPEKQVADDVKSVIDQARPAIREEFNKLLSPTIAKLELTDMLNRHGDSFKQVAPQVANKVKENPSLSMEDAFKLVSYDNVKRTSHTQGVNEANANVEAKQKAQVETAKPSGIKPVGIDEAIADKNVGTAEIADALGPEYEMFKEISDRRSGKT